MATAEGEKTGGRAAGTPNKAGSEVQGICRRLLESPEYLAGLKRRLEFGSCAPAVEVLIWHYAYHQPTKTHKHTGKFTLEQLIAGTAVDDDENPTEPAS